MASIVLFDLNLYVHNPHNPNAKDTTHRNINGSRFMAGDADKYNKLLMRFVIYW